MESIGTTCSDAPIFICVHPLVSKGEISLPCAATVAAWTTPLFRKVPPFNGEPANCAIQFAIVSLWVIGWSDSIASATIGGVALAAKGKTKTSSKGRGKRKGKSKATKGVDQRLVKALAHELRVQILTILNERMASPNELAKELDEGLSQVSYHVKVLKDYDCIKLVKTEPRRGAVEHYYRATSRAFLTDRDWRELPDSVRPGMSADLLELIISDTVTALEKGTFDDRVERHLSWTPLVLDEKGWRDMIGVMDGALERILKIQADSAARLAKKDEDGITASVAMLGFETPEGTRKKAKAPRKAQASRKRKAKKK